MSKPKTEAEIYREALVNILRTLDSRTLPGVDKSIRIDESMNIAKQALAEAANASPWIDPEVDMPEEDQLLILLVKDVGPILGSLYADPEGWYWCREYSTPRYDPETKLWHPEETEDDEIEVARWCYFNDFIPLPGSETE